MTNQSDRFETQPSKLFRLQVNRDKITDAPFTFDRYLLSPIIFLLIPFWLIFGRFMLGSCGWITVFYSVFILPILFAISILFYLWLKNNYNEKITCLFGEAGHLLIPGLYLSLFLHGFFLIDAGDVGPGVSVATKLFGSSIYELSHSISIAFIFITMLIIILTFASIIVYAVKHKVKMSQDKKRYTQITSNK